MKYYKMLYKMQLPGFKGVGMLVILKDDSTMIETLGEALTAMMDVEQITREEHMMYKMSGEYSCYGKET
jgi:hypothetical protein